MPIWLVTWWKPLSVIGLVVIAVAAWEWHGTARYKDGQTNERQRHETQINKQADEAREIAREVHNETAAMSDDDIDADLERWVRNKGAGRD